MNNTNYDPLNIQFKDLNVGFLVDYDLKTWQVQGGAECGLEENIFKRFILNNGKDTVNIFYNLLKEKVYLLEEFEIKLLNNTKEILLKGENPPKQIDFNNKKYLFDKKYEGQSRDLSKNSHDWHRMIAWFFDSEDMKTILFIGQKGPKEFITFTLKEIQEKEFTNILPAK